MFVRITGFLREENVWEDFQNKCQTFRFCLLFCVPGAFLLCKHKHFFAIVEDSGVVQVLWFFFANFRSNFFIGGECLELISE